MSASATCWELLQLGFCFGNATRRGVAVANQTHTSLMGSKIKGRCRETAPAPDSTAVS